MLKFKQYLEEDLRTWFKQKWVRMDTKGNIKGDCAREPGEGKPKCLPQAKAHAIGKDARASAAQRKRREDPNPERKGKPINVATEGVDEACWDGYTAKGLKKKGNRMVPNCVPEEVKSIEEKNVPTSPEKWARAKAAAKSKFAVYPSAYANGWASKKYKSMGGGWRTEEVEELFDVIEEMVEAAATEHNIDSELLWERLESVSDEELIEESAAWQRKAGKDPEGGLNRKGIASYRRENPGSKLSMAVTTKPSKLKPGSKAANRRKSFCARMSGMKKRLTSAKTARDPDSRINKSLRKWNC